MISVQNKPSQTIWSNFHISEMKKSRPPNRDEAGSLRSQSKAATASNMAPGSTAHILCASCTLLWCGGVSSMIRSWQLLSVSYASLSVDPKALPSGVGRITPILTLETARQLSSPWRLVFQNQLGESGIFEQNGCEHEQLALQSN